MQYLDVLANEFRKLCAYSPLALGALCPDAGARWLVGQGEDDATELWMTGADLRLASLRALLVLPLGRGAGGVLLPREGRSAPYVVSDTLRYLVRAHPFSACETPHCAGSRVPCGACADRKGGRAGYAGVRST